MDKAVPAVLAVFITLLSGLGDAYGFVHASRSWRDGRVVGTELALSVAGFALGIAAYIVVVRYFDQLGVRAPELQSLGWFAVTVIGIAAIQRTVLDWSAADRVIGLLAVASVGWLVVRHG